MAGRRRSLRESKERFAKKKQRWRLILAGCGGALLLIFFVRIPVSFKLGEPVDKE